VEMAKQKSIRVFQIERQGVEIFRRQCSMRSSLIAEETRVGIPYEANNKNLLIVIVDSSSRCI
jgi:hypothetical protein